MIKTFRTAFLLKNTYRVNTILYAIKQIPLLNRLLPQAIYRVYGLKIFANILAVLWELVSIFLGKALYILQRSYAEWVFSTRRCRRMKCLRIYYCFYL